MHRIRNLLILTLLTIGSGNIFSQTTDSLWVNTNPFSTSTKINCYIHSSDTVSLEMYNIWGGTVVSFFNDSFLQQGTYSFTYGDTLPDGIYIVVLFVGSKKGVGNRIFKKATASEVVNENHFENGLLIYPNPITDGFLNIAIKQMNWAKAQIMIYDNLGQLVNQTEPSRIRQDGCEIPVGYLSRGIYIVHIISDDQRQSVKFIKQ